MCAAPVILITGASSGFGEATAYLFGEEGYRVVLAARRQDRLEAIAGRIRLSGGEALPVQADLARLEDIQWLAQTAIDGYGQVDVLLNNAGFGRLDWLENLDPQKDIEAQVRVNLLGVIQMTRAVLPHMIARRSGHIIQMASMAGIVATPTYSVYAATKFGLRGFSEALRREVGIYGIRISVLYPGGANTEFAERAGIRRRTRHTTPEGLRLSAGDVAKAVLRTVRRPRRGLLLPWQMTLAAWANTLFPGLVDRAIERGFTRPERLGQ